MNFTEYISQVYAFGNVTLEATDVVIVSEIDFLTNVSAIIDITSPRIVQNYFVWRFILDQSSNFPRYYRAAREQFDRIFQGTNAEQTRPTKCAIFVNNNMGMVVSKLYIKRFFDENARNQVGRSVGKLSIGKKTCWHFFLVVEYDREYSIIFH